MRIRVVALFFISFLLAGLLFPLKHILAASYTLSGSVKDNSSNAISGAAITIIDPSNNNATVGSTSTDNSGNYTISLSEGTYTIQVSPPSSSNFGSASSPSQAIHADKIINFVLVTVGSPVILSGHVYDPSGNPIANQEVYLQPPSGSTIQTNTDANGAYSLQIVSGTSGYLYVTNPFPGNGISLNIPDRYHLYVANYTVNQSTVLDFTIPAKQVTVHVQDGSNNPISGVNLQANSTTDSVIPIANGLSGHVDAQYGYGNNPRPTTDSSGNATLWLVPQTYTFIATPPSGGNLEPGSITNVSITDTATETITLPASVTLSGHVYDPSGNPVAGQEVYLHPSNGSDILTYTDANGAYLLQAAPGTYPFFYVQNPFGGNNIPNVPTKYHLIVQNYSLSQNTTIDFTIPAKKVTLYIQDSSNNPVSNVTVQATSNNALSVPIANGLNGNVDSSSTAVTNSSGNAILWVVPDNYNFLAVPSGSSNLKQNSLNNIDVASDTNETITLLSPITLSGHVHDSSGNPVSGQEVYLHPSSGSDILTYTDTNGAYALQAGSGTYPSLYVQNPFPGNGILLGVPDRYYIFVQNYVLSQDTTLDFTIPIKKLTVHVQDAFGNPISSVNFQATTIGDTTITVANGVTGHVGSSYGYPGNSRPTTDSSGDATILLTPGSYTLTATPPSGSIYSQFTLNNISVTADQTEVISLQFSHPAPVTTANLATLNPDGSYSDPTIATLSAIAANGYTVATSYYTIDGGSTQTYSSPFTISGVGSHTITYWSIDNSGVQESPNTKTFTIRSAPGIPENSTWTKFAGSPGANQIVDDPTNPNTLYAGGDGFWKSTDGGFSWSELDNGILVANGTTKRVQSIAVAPSNPNIIYIGTAADAFHNPNARLYKSTDAGLHWTDVTNNILQAQPYDPDAIAVDPTDPNIAYVAFYSNCMGLWKTTDGGASWVHEPTNCDTYQVKIDPVDHNTIYYGGNVLYKSTDAGATWTAPGSSQLSGVGAVRGIAIDPTNTSTLYVGTERNSVYKSIDGGNTWTFLSNGPTGQVAEGLYMDRDDSQTIYGGTLCPALGCNAIGSFRSHDGGSTWESFNFGNYPQNINYYFIPEKDHTHLYATTNTGIYVYGPALTPPTNFPPSVTITGNASVNEGDTVTYTFAVSDQDGDSFSVNGDPSCGTNGTYVPNSLTVNATGGTFQCSFPNGNTSTDVNIQVTDSGGLSSTATGETVTVANLPPGVGGISAPTSPVDPGSPVTILVNFTDPGSGDTHTAIIDWGDGTSSAGTVTESGGSGSVSGSHSYTTPGNYTITVTVTDNSGASGSSTAPVEVNAPPSANAGGPYTAHEGSTVTLTGSGTDPDGDTLTYTWDLTGGTNFTTPGQSVTFSGIDGPATKTVTLQVCDTFGACSTSSATVRVTNVVPTVQTITVVPSQPQQTQGITATANFTDPGIQDTHTALWDWGDGSASQAGTVTENNGSGSVSDTHTYTTYGTYTITLTVTDKDGGRGTQTQQIFVNAPPVANPGGPYVMNEGDLLLLQGNATDPDGDSLTYSWDLNNDGVYDITGQNALFSASNGPATQTVVLKVCDNHGACDIKPTTITINNVAPTVGSLTFNPSQPTANQATTVSAHFSDPGVLDTHTASINWGDTTQSAGIVSEASGSGSVQGAHTYSADGTYTVTMTIRDNDGGVGTQTTMLHIVNPTPTPSPTPTATPTPTPVMTPYFNSVTSLSPVAYYRLGETSGTTARNDVLNTPNGTYTGGTTLGQSGPLAHDVTTATQFNGSTGYVDIPYNSSLNPSQFSVEAWVYPTGSSSRYWGVLSSRRYPLGYVLYGNNTDPAHPFWTLWVNSGNGMTATGQNANTAITLNQWTHLVATFDGTHMKLYVNGVLAGTATTNAFNPNTATDETIGQGEPGSNYFFPGKIEDVAFYGNILSATNVANQFASQQGPEPYISSVLHNNPSSYYRLGESSGSVANNRATGPTGTYTGGVTLGQTGAIGNDVNKAVGFNGTNGYVDIPYTSSLNTHQFSVEAWVYPTGSSSRYWGVLASRNWPYGYVLYANNTNSSHPFWTFWANSGNDMMATGTSPNPNGSSDVHLNQWNYLVATYDGANVRLYVNGVYAASVADTNFAPNTTSHEAIGQGEPGSGFFFPGKIDEASYYPNVLSQSDISAHYALR